MIADSKLVDQVIPISNYTHLTNKTNDRIVIHHMAGILNAQQTALAFRSRSGSAQYAITSDNQIVQFVPESERAWTTSTYVIDNRAVTIEVSNDTGAPAWHVSDRNIARLIDLVTDICQRNGIQNCTFINGDRNNSVLQMHRWWASTECPGPYLSTKFSYIANEVNKRLRGAKMELPIGYSKQTVSGITAHVYRSNHKDGLLPFFINSSSATELKPIAEFDSDDILKEAVVNANYFQMKTGQADTYGTHYGVEMDSRIEHYAQAPKSEGLLAYYMLRDESCHVCKASNFWYSEEEVLFACTPYAVRVHDGKLTYDRSTALGDKDDIRNTQTVLAKIEGDWCIGSFSACYPRDTVTFFQAFGSVQELCVFDSGGSAQMRAWTNGKMQTVASGDGRKIPNVIALARLINTEPATELETPDPTPEEPAPTENPLQAEVDVLKAENAELKAENAELKRKIESAKEALN